jgi:AraC-like DNA-binding protein
VRETSSHTQAAEVAVARRHEFDHPFDRPETRTATPTALTARTTARSRETLLAEVFGFIADSYHEPISLRDVARAVSLSRGHLTTVVRRKTGRTVQEWIAERRMAEARRLLVETELSVEEVGRRVGYGESGYFVRSFRRTHGATPLAWRRAGSP